MFALLGEDGRGGLVSPPGRLQPGLLCKIPVPFSPLLCSEVLLPPPCRLTGAISFASSDLRFLTAGAGVWRTLINMASFSGNGLLDALEATYSLRDLKLD